MSDTSPIKYSLALLFYVIALIASAIAAFGLPGILFAGAVMYFWYGTILLVRDGVSLAQIIVASLIIAALIAIQRDTAFEPQIRVTWERVIAVCAFGVLCVLPAFFWVPKSG